MVSVFLSLGANLGDREAALRQALERLNAEVEVCRASSLYETEPVGMKEQPWFLNLVCGGETRLPPGRLLDFVQGVEEELGRVRGVRFGPRTIDIDILFYGELILDTPRLAIPHPRLHQRAFVLVPLAEIAPELAHPVLGLSVGQLLQRLKTEGEAPLLRRYAGRD